MRQPASARPPTAAGVVCIPLRKIRLNLSNPRKHIDEQELAELAESIRRHGLLQPILVRPLTAEERGRHRREYQIVIGSRRFHAAELAGLEAIDCYVRGLSPDESELASFLDHAHHRTLTPGEEAEFLRYLRDQRRLKLREIAAILAKSISYVSRRLGVAAHPELDEAVRRGRISQAAAQEILRAPAQWWPTLVEHSAGLSADQVRALVDAVADSDLTAEAVSRLFAAGDARVRPAEPAGPPLARPDGAWRQHGPVERVQTTPAFQLLRHVHGWSAALPPDWRPTPADVELLEEAAALIRGAAARAGEATRTDRKPARADPRPTNAGVRAAARTPVPLLPTVLASQIRSGPAGRGKRNECIRSTEPASPVKT
jgi:ParB family chromosome partitioning protein